MEELIAKIVGDAIANALRGFTQQSYSGKWMPLNEAAEYAAVSPETLRKASKNGEIRYRVAGGGELRETRLFNTNDLDCWGLVEKGARAQTSEQDEIFLSRATSVPAAKKAAKRAKQ